MSKWRPCHCAASDYESTDWRQILLLYDRLAEIDDSPVVALNRAIVVANVDGPLAGIEALRAIRNLDKLNSFYLLHAVLGEFQARLGHAEAAAGHFRKSLELAEIQPEQSFLSKRIQACEAPVQARGNAGDAGAPLVVDDARQFSARKGGMSPRRTAS
jgi:predicted RNA polymerase sigma factor